ncbi:MAG: MBL fold metallo-hydrolase, partial [Leptospiraceae bacterium]|nr:MBL fold metallo-hydrolase [Leptospiraceae bacterium]
MKITLYGTRGSLPAPLRNSEYKEKVLEILERFHEKTITDKSEIKEFFEYLPPQLKYTGGGDTTCVHLSSEKGKTYVLDLGSGVRNVGNDLLKSGFLGGDKVLEVFITHTHWDHIQGLMFFKPFYIPGVSLNFYSPYPDLEERFIYQMQPKYFPVDFNMTMSKKNFKSIHPGDRIEFDDGIKVECHPLKHPGGSYAYKFSENGKVFIFATDAEFTGEDIPAIRDMADFFGGADYLIIDSQYTLDESFKKFDWGHTSYTMAVNCATVWGVKNLILTHHEPDYDDKK